jgi:hypothetical protein
LATWLVSHAVLGDRNDALVGDLQEEFQTRRSRAWYWRQVFGAILSGFANEWRSEWSASGYAVLWTFLFGAFWTTCVVYLGPELLRELSGKRTVFLFIMRHAGSVRSVTSEIPIALYLVTLCIGLGIYLASMWSFSPARIGHAVLVGAAALLVGQVAEGFLVGHIFLVARLVDWFGWDLYLHGFDWIRFFVALLLSMWTANPNWRRSSPSISRSTA